MRDYQEYTSRSNSDNGQPRYRANNRQNTPEPTITSPAENATVKWYNPTKGYGFVETESGKDLFLHASVLQRNGITEVNAGDLLTIHSGPGREAGREAVLKASMRA